MYTIKFDKPTYFGSKGRNGYLSTHGVEICDMGSLTDEKFAEVHIHPITSRGAMSEACRVTIRKSAIPDLIKALIDALGPPPARLPTRATMKRYRRSPTSISTASGH